VTRTGRTLFVRSTIRWDLQNPRHTRVRQRTFSKWVEFEDTPTLGGFQRTFQIDPIDGANEPDTEWYSSRERAQDVAKEADSLRRVQLGRTYLFSGGVR
jgi:hypothetical protein